MSPAQRSIGGQLGMDALAALTGRDRYRPLDRDAARAAAVELRQRLRDTDPDLVGWLRLDGRLVQLRGWVIELADTAHIRIEARK